MLKTDYELENEENLFNPFEDIEILSHKDNLCIIRTRKLLDTLKFMQEWWWRLYELTPDDEWVSWVRIERNILIYYKPKCKNT